LSELLKNEEDITGTFWYFAIGSMINKTSINSRKIYPRVTKPAELLDFKLYFFGALGMAEAIPEEDSSFHGVVHAVTEDEMEKLDKIEAGYTRDTGKAKLYDGTIVDVSVYVRKGKSRGPQFDKPPTERYLDIITRGCKLWGVKQSHIDYLWSLEN
jgi:gamma-glutamylcyclotransferase (GGCT)/AIG2-like uncharacterized protein YtfP